MELDRLGGTTVLQGSDVDANAFRERSRRRRFLRLAVLLASVAVWLWTRNIAGDPVRWGIPTLPSVPADVMMPLLLTALLAVVIGAPLVASGRSPHVVLRPSDVGVRMADVVGAPGTTRQAVDTLNLFLAHRTFTEVLGGNPRRGVLFEGPPGTGKTYLAKAMAGEAGVPFLYVSASSFQSMYYGSTNRKIRTFFRELRRAARREGGAIGFIEEFDAIGSARANMGSGNVREGVAGIVNELLVQMQSFDLPTGRTAFVGKIIDRINLWMPAHRQIPRPVDTPANVLVVAATNRASDLDPALLRPGRFDRLIHFGLPAREDRRAIAQYYLSRKAHDATVTDDGLAEVTSGYSPVRIERLLDEALVCALRHRRAAMTWADVLEARLSLELGESGVSSPDLAERRRVAMHEAAHAVLAEHVGRRVTVASILRRSDALGLVAHVDVTERSLTTASEARALMEIALAGLVAEELELGEASSGAAGDLAAATTIAAQLVGAMGLGGSRLSMEAAVMPGAGNLVAKVLAHDPSRDAAEKLIGEAEAAAREILVANRHALMALSTALLEHDELDGDTVRQILSEASAAGRSALIAGTQAEEP